MTDPSMSGTPTGTLAARYSLAEIDATCRKAARGAGYAWGLAEEAGKAARWLAARDLPGPEALAGLLTDTDGKDYADIQPVLEGAAWQARGGILCPLILGTVIADRGGEFTPQTRIHCAALARPLLLLPFLARLAAAADCCLAGGWGRLEFVIGPRGFVIDDPGAGLLAAETGRMQIQVAAAAPPPAAPEAGGRAVPARAWRSLDHFAARTYAPATEASRLAGAGAGVRDSD